MANFLDKIKIRTGVGAMNKFNLSCDHVTTQDFFKLRPIYVRELMPKQSIEIEPTSWLRMAPLFKPFFGHVKLINRAFFVPYRTVFESFNDFLVNVPHSHDGDTYMVSQVPTFKASDFASAIVSRGFAESVSGDGAYDFFYPSQSDSSTDGINYRFTAKGRFLMTVLHSLGYSFIFTRSLGFSPLAQDMTFSALPMLAFCKILSDWYCNNQYPSRRNDFEQLLSSVWRGGPLDAGWLTAFFDTIIYSYYDNDYFTAAFDNAVNPTSGSYSDVSIPDVTNTGSSATNKSGVFSKTTEGSITTLTPSIRRSDDVNSSVVSNLTQYLVDSLKSLTDYMKRYQLVGSSALDRILAEYGVQLSSEQLNRCVYLGKIETDLQVSDVMSTSDTSQGVVGDYAAKGVMLSNTGKFSYKADEFGVIMIVSSIVPKISYSQGVNRRNLHIDRFDFFRGDFDAIGPQAIACSELYNEGPTKSVQSSLTNVSWSPNKIFGYSPRYSEYCIPTDWLSGSFRFNSQNGDLGSWHLFRMFNPDTNDGARFISHHSEDFTVGEGSQYDRIFNYSDDDVDHFYAVHHFEVTSYMPKKPLFDQYDFDGGNSILMNLGGSNLN